MAGLIVAIVGLALAQLAAIVSVARWAGAKDEREKNFLTREEYERGQRAVLDAAKQAASQDVQRVVDSVVASSFRSERDSLQRAADRERDELRRQLETVDKAKETLAKLDARWERMAELSENDKDFDDALDKLRTEIATLRGTIGEFANQSNQFAWRVEAMENAFRRKLGTDPRIFAVREQPERRSGDEPRTLHTPMRMRPALPQPLPRSEDDSDKPKK